MKWLRRWLKTVLTGGIRFCMFSACLEAPKFMCLECHQVFCGYHAHIHDEEVGDEVQAGS